MLHFCFDSAVEFPWPSVWVSWLESLTFAFSFDRHVPRGWEACLVVLVLSLLLIIAFVAYGAVLNKWHNQNKFARIQEVVLNSYVSSTLCWVVPLVCACL